MKSNTTLNNQDIAAVLREIGEQLRIRGDNPFRVAAYRKAATLISVYPGDVATIFDQEGEAGLRRLPAIGKSLAREIARLLKKGHSTKLARLRDRSHQDSLLQTLPGVGAILAQRLQQTLGSNSLLEVSAAVQDGRLRRIPGFGCKRLRSVRESLASRFAANQARAFRRPLSHPSIGDLLSIDSEYREKASAGRLPLVNPRDFNPTRSLWLPILRTERSGRRFSVRSHQLDAFRDWVTITCETKQYFGQWTVITATRGRWRGRRLVKGLEQDCDRYYRDLKVQLPLLDV